MYSDHNPAPRPLSIVQTSAPAIEPVTLAEAKTHMRVDIADDDAFITSLITAAREHAEVATQRQFITATYELRLDDFPHRYHDTILLPKPKLQAVSSIVYTDAGASPVTIDPTTYQVDLHTEPARIRPAYGQVWPYIRQGQLGAVVITFTAGYGDTAATVPGGIKQAIKIIVSDMYENRESLAMGRGEQPFPVPFAAAALLGPFRVMQVY